MPKKWDSGIGRIAIFVFSALFTLLLSEIVYRQIQPQRKFEDKVYIKTKENWGACYSSDPAHSFPLDLRNSRDFAFLSQNLEGVSMTHLQQSTPHCILYDKVARRQGFFPQRKRQWHRSGDSFTFGDGVKEEETLAYFLSQQFTDTNFRNYGEMALEIGQINWIVEQTLEKNPEVEALIYFFNLNDILHAPQMSLQGIIDLQNIRWFRSQDFKRGKISQFLSASTIYERLYNAWLLKRETRRTVQYYLDLYLGAENASYRIETFRLLQSMHQKALAKNRKFYVVIYPLLYTSLTGSYPFQSIHDLLISTCSQRKIPCVDGYKAFAKYSSLKPFTVHAVDFHPNAKANQQLVNYLAREGTLRFP